MTYWTGIWEPAREAISKEVALLRTHLSPASPVVSFTPQSSGVLVHERVLRLHYSRWLALRAAALAIERFGEVTHMFGGLDAAHFLLLLGRRPLLFTVTIAGEPLPLHLYRKASRFVAESRELARSLMAAGVAGDSIEVIYPGVDLSKYVDVPPPAGRLSILFASTPAEPDEIEQRGLDLLIDLARARPDIDIVILWRCWGPVRAGLAEIERRRPPRNFIVRVGDVADMAGVYPTIHATACCFAAGYGKSAPNSIIEGMASGRPVLVTDTCGIADLIGESGAGVVTRRSVDGLSAGVDEMRSAYARLRANARRLAEREFDQRQLLARYQRLYARLANG